MRTVGTVGLLLGIAAIPRVAWAQSPEPELPPIIEAGPRPLDSRPMRFLLSTGAVVIGTRIGENATAIGVQTQTGIVTLLKEQIVTMDYDVHRGRSFDLGTRSPVPLARPAPLVPEPDPRQPPPERRRPRKPGRGAIIAGGIIFGLSYGVACLGALIATGVGDEPAGGLLVIPVAGPLVWALVERDHLESGLILLAGESLGAALLAAGIVAANERPDRQVMRVTPLLTAEVQGLWLSGTL